MHVIPSRCIALDASAGTITLDERYKDIELAQILKIIDLTTNDIVYDVDINRKTVTSVTGGVISYTTTNTKITADTDDILIFVNDVYDEAGYAMVLTNSAGTALTADSDASGFYDIVASGAETLSFFLDWDGSKKFRLIDINVCANAAITLVVALKFYVLGAWKEKLAYSMSLNTTEAQQINTIYPLIEDIPIGTKVKLDITTGGAGTVSVNVVAR